MQEKDIAILRQEIDDANEKGITQLAVPGSTFGAAAENTLTIYPAQINALRKAARYYYAGNVRLRDYLITLYQYTLAIDEDDSNEEEGGVKKLADRPPHLYDRPNVDLHMAISIFLGQHWAFMQPILIFSDLNDQLLAEPYPVTVLNTYKIDFNKKFVHEYFFGKNDSNHKDNSYALLVGFFKTYLEKDLQFCQTLNITTVLLTTSSLFHLENNDEHRREILENAYWQSLSSLAKKYQSLTIYLKLSDRLKSKFNNDNANVHFHNSHDKILKLCKEYGVASLSRNRKVALQNPVALQTFLKTSQLPNVDEVSLKIQKIINFSLALISEETVLSEVSVLSSRENNDSFDYLSLDDEYTIFLDDTESHKNKVILDLGTAFSHEFSILFSIFENSKNEDPFGIFEKGRNNYSKVQTIKIDTLVEFILRYPGVASTFFRRRRYAVGLIPFSTAILRDFRHELCDRPDLIEKLINSNNEEILSAMKHEELLTSNYLKEPDKRRLAIQWLFISLTLKYLSETTIAYFYQEFDALQLTAYEWLHLINEHLDNKSDNDKNKFFYLLRNSKQAIAVLMPFFKDYSINEIAYRPTFTRLLSSGFLIADKLMEFFYDREEGVKLFLTALIKNKFYNKDSKTISLDVDAEVALEKLEITAKELFLFMSKTLVTWSEPTEKVRFFDLLETYLSDTFKNLVVHIKKQNINNFIKTLYAAGFILGSLLNYYHEAEEDTKLQLFLDSLKTITDVRLLCDYTLILRPEVATAVANLNLSGEKWLQLLSTYTHLNKLCSVILGSVITSQSIRYALVKNPKLITVLRQCLLSQNEHQVRLNLFNRIINDYDVFISSVVGSEVENHKTKDNEAQILSVLNDNLGGAENLVFTPSEWSIIIDYLNKCEVGSPVFYNVMIYLLKHETEADKIRILIIQNPDFLNRLFELGEKQSSSLGFLQPFKEFITKILIGSRPNYYHNTISNDFYSRGLSGILELPSTIQLLHINNPMLAERLIRDFNEHDLFKVIITYLNGTQGSANPPMLREFITLFKDNIKNNFLLYLLEIRDIIYNELFLLYFTPTDAQNPIKYNMTTLNQIAVGMNNLKNLLSQNETIRNEILPTDSISLTHDQWKKINDFVAAKCQCPLAENIDKYLTEKLTEIRRCIGLLASKNSNSTFFNGESVGEGSEKPQSPSPGASHHPLPQAGEGIYSGNS